MILHRCYNRGIVYTLSELSNLLNTIRMESGFNPEFAVETYCGAKPLAVPTRRDFAILLLNRSMDMPSSLRNYALRLCREAFSKISNLITR